jgi:hypothetical protein
MSRRPTRRALAIAGAAVLAVPAVAQARDVYATDTAGNLHRFDTRFPGVILDTVPVTGLPQGVSVVGLDVRPATGDLVAVGSNSVVYTLNADTGTATAIGTGFTPGLTGTGFGVDVNPVPDALRVTTNTDLNFRISFATGNHGAGSPDGAINPADPQVVGSAYLNSSLTATRPAATTLFVLDAAGNQLFTQSPPNAGTLVDPKPLGVDITDNTGFDIADNLGYMVTVPQGAAGSTLYRVDLATGRATRLGPVATGSLLNRGTSRVVLTGLALRQKSAAPRTNIAPTVQIVPTTNRPRPGQAAAYIAQATDADGEIQRIEWDTDGDGTFEDLRGGARRIALGAGVRTIGVRATDDSGARTTARLRVTVAR